MLREGVRFMVLSVSVTSAAKSSSSRMRVSCQSGGSLPAVPGARGLQGTLTDVLPALTTALGEGGVAVVVREEGAPRRG